jgi:hypothetical protein
VSGDVSLSSRSGLKGDRSQPKKHRHTAHHMCERLLLRTHSLAPKDSVGACEEAHFKDMAIPLEYDVGNDAQSNWGEAWAFSELGVGIYVLQIMPHGKKPHQAVVIIDGC